MHATITRALEAIDAAIFARATYLPGLITAKRDLQSLGEALERLETRQREWMWLQHPVRCCDFDECCPHCRAWGDFELLYPPDPPGKLPENLSR